MVAAWPGIDPSANNADAVSLIVSVCPPVLNRALANRLVASAASTIVAPDRVMAVAIPSPAVFDKLSKAAAVSETISL